MRVGFCSTPRQTSSLNFGTFPSCNLPGAIRDTALVGIVLIDSQIDHTTGLLMLREGNPLRIYCTQSVREDLATGNPLFKVLGHYCGVEWQQVSTDAQASFRVSRCRATRVPHGRARQQGATLFPASRQSQRGRQYRGHVSDEATGKTLFYAPGLGAHRAASCAHFRARRLPARRRHVLDRRRNDPARNCREARARYRPSAAVGPRWHDRSACTVPADHARS